MLIYIPTSCTVGNLHPDRPKYRLAIAADEIFGGGGLEDAFDAFALVDECGGLCPLFVAQPFGINWGGK